MGTMNGGRQWVLIGLVLVLALVSVVLALRPRVAPTPGVFVGEASLTDAMASAREGGRVVVAVATADWCAPCQAYKRGALADPEVQAWLEANSVPVMVDVTDEPPAEAGFLNIGPIPTTYVVTGEGEVVSSAVGAMGSDELLVFLRESLAEAQGGR